MSTPDILSIANSAVVDLFKTKYVKYLDSHHNKEHPFVAMVPKDPSVTGNTQTVQMKFGALGGYAAGAYKDAGHVNYDNATFTLKNLYFRGIVDAKSIELSRDRAGAARKIVSEAMLEANREIARNLERQMVYGDGTGSVGKVASSSGVVDNGSGNYTLTLDSTEWVRDNFHDGILLNIGSSGTSKFRVDLAGVDKANKKITVSRLDGSDVPADSDPIYMQGSKDNEAEGIRGIVKATSGTKYGKTIGSGWKSEQLDASSERLSREMLLDVAYNIFHETGRRPDKMLMPAAQWKKLIHLGESDKLQIDYREARAGSMNIGSIPHFFLDGVAVPIMVMLTMPDSEVYLVNMDDAVMKMYSAGAGAFVPGNDGFMWYRGQFGSDEFEFFWKKYCEFFVHPTYQGVIHTLSTTVVA